MNFNDFYKLDNIVMNVTNTCNRHCKYCYAHTKSGMMGVNTAELILDKCYKNHLEKGSDKKFNVSFYGGEPLLNWNCIKHSLEYSKEKGYDISFGVTTNLTILTDEMIKYFKEYNVHLLISIDGRKETHDRNRDNSFDLVLENVKRLFENGLENQMEARPTIMPYKCDELSKDIEYLIELGFKTISPVIVRDTLWNEEDYDNLMEGLVLTWELYFGLWNDNKPVKIKLCDDYIDKDLVLGNKKQQEVCRAGDCKSCSIGVYGEIMPCHQRHLIDDKFDEFRNGFITSDEVKDVNFNNYTRKSKTYDCEQCEARVICKGGCPSENWTENGDSNLMNATQCNIERIMFIVADREIQRLGDDHYNNCDFLQKVHYNRMLIEDLSDVLVEIVKTKKMNLIKIDILLELLKRNEEKIFPSTWATYNEVLENICLDK